MHSAGPVVIHVMHDEKFNDMAIRQFESSGICRNEYWVLSPRLLLTKSSAAISCGEDELIKQLNRKDLAAVVFHSLPPARYKLLGRVGVDKLVFWIGWGYDYYSITSRADGLELVGNATRRLDPTPLFVRVKRIVKRILGELGAVDSGVSSLERVDYFSPVLDVEFEKVVDAVGLRSKYIEWNYGTVEDDFSVIGQERVGGKDVLVGNSASLTNNHVEIFELLAREDGFKGRIVCPLSYGDARYAEKVSGLGRDLFGDRFLPLLEFMPNREYLKIIGSCGFVVMGHLRQQAVGNVCSALFLGAKVYLDSRNPLSNWLVSRGAVIGDVSRLDFIPLSDREIEVNRSVVLGQWGRVAQARKTERFLLKAISRFSE